MTEWREELIEKMAKAIAVRPQDSENRWWIWEPEARAALAVAEPVIREQADIALREELAAVTERMSKLDFERTAAKLERDALREENALLEERNKKLNADLFKQAELTAVTMTRCADLMPAQSAIVKLKDQQAEIDALKAEVAQLRKLLFDFEKFQQIYEKAMESK